MAMGACVWEMRPGLGPMHVPQMRVAMYKPTGSVTRQMHPNRKVHLHWCLNCRPPSWRCCGRSHAGWEFIARFWPVARLAILRGAGLLGVHRSGPGPTVPASSPPPQQNESGDGSNDHNHNKHHHHSYDDGTTVCSIPAGAWRIFWRRWRNIVWPGSCWFQDAVNGVPCFLDMGANVLLSWNVKYTRQIMSSERAVHIGCPPCAATQA